MKEESKEIIAIFDIEEWKQIEDFPDYAVSNKGRVKRTTSRPGHAVGKIISQRLNPNPKYSKCCYPSIRLAKNGTYENIRKVHQLVLTAFIGPRPKGYVSNHKDGNKLNNHIDNLEWTTQSKNVKHAFDIGLKKNKKGADHWAAKLKREEVWLIRKLLHSKKFTQKFISKMFKVDHSTISLIACNKHYKRQEVLSC